MSQATTMAAEPAKQEPLSGLWLWIAALILGSSNFIAVLNLTLANVAVPSIAGGLGAASSQSTWIITAYAVGEAITVPLTGWLAARFGAIRVFVVSMIMFGVFSALCGLSTSLGMIVVMRVFQGFCGGPLMPLSQTLLLRVFPKERAAVAIGLWSMTMLVAPVVGPILGGWICDEYSWSWIFLLNVPIGIGFGWWGWLLLRRYQDQVVRARFDFVGLILLVIWVAALQIMLDEGKNLDWFASNEIIVLAIIAVLGLCVFVIWELHEPNPVVDLRVFRHRGFTVSVINISASFACFFAVQVLTPLWLQNFMGYTPTDAGLATMWSGITAFFVAPLVAQAVMKKDPRLLVFMGVSWMGLTTLWRVFATTDMGFWDIALPLLFLGFGMPLFFVPATSLSLASVEEAEMDSAAGIMNFLRTLGGAFATSLVTTVWSNQITRNHAELVAVSDPHGETLAMMQAAGAPPDVALNVFDYLVTSQAVMLATNQLLMWIGVIFFFAAAIIWLAPRPTRSVDPATGAH